LTRAEWLLGALREAGFRVRSEGKTLWVTPGRMLSETDLRWIAEEKSALLGLLDGERDITPSDRDFLGRTF